MKEATPEGFSVERTGRTEPAHSQYFVLNITDDARAREALAYLGRQYAHDKRDQLSQECFDLLDATRPAFSAVVASRQPKKK